MKMLFSAFYWTQVISEIIHLYLKDTSVCVLWNPNLNFDLETRNFHEYYTIVNIKLKNLKKSFEEDIVDFKVLEERLTDNDLGYNELTEKLTMAIEQTYCESFLAFEDDIFSFIESFINASQYSDWRSKKNRFVFVYTNENFEKDFIQHKFFSDQNGILLVSPDPSAANIFNFKTNKFHGPKSEKQSSLIFLDQYNASDATFLYNRTLFPDKIVNLMGREIILAGFDYRPYSVVNYNTESFNSYDLSDGELSLRPVHVDGTEVRIAMTFCEIYNCTILIDSSEATDWGEVYANLTGDFSLGMVMKDKAEFSVGAMYSWVSVYLQLDMSMYLARSGITCLVPAPRRLASWLLPLQPFQYTLWLAIALYMFVETVSLCFTHMFDKNINGQRGGTWVQSFKFGYVTTVKLFLSQSGSSNVRSLTLRILLFTCFMNDIIITSIYGGGLASILTIPSYEKAADTVEGMLYHKLKWTANSEAWVLTLRNNDDERINGIMENFHIYNDEELEILATTRFDMGFTVERLPFGHFAIGEYLSSKTIEHLKIMKEDLYFQYTVAFVKRCWPLLERFDQLVYWWHSAGLDKYWEWRVVTDNLNVKIQKQVEASMYSNTEEEGPEKLGMANFIGILLIWVIGILISLIAFGYELLENHFKCKT